MKELEGEIQTDLKIQPGTENSEGHLSGLSLFLQVNPNMQDKRMNK